MKKKKLIIFHTYLLVRGNDNSSTKSYLKVFMEI